ncbi:MarR family transcriptional regulator [Micromonospora sp. URMC 103]|uniref:MarR family transcriptional regulator n=1 Tax=Micromonospora sp. URMC 103 TaxID=3423406 RepID=UPI003F196E53
MTDMPEAVPAHSMFKVLAALAALGETTASAVAEHAELGYSTTTAKLRAWEQTGQAERLRTDDGRTLWRLTDTGRAATADPDQRHAPAAPDPGTAAGRPETADEPDQNGQAVAAPEQSDQFPAAPDDPPVEPGNHQPADPHPNTTGPETPAGPPNGPGDDGDGRETAVEPTPGNEQPASPSENTRSEASHDTARRRKGSLRGAILGILEAHPERQYKTGELCRLIDAANAGSGARKASAGAVANAVIKLVADGSAVQTLEKPATYQLAPTTGHQ